MHSFIMIAWVSVIWALYGYSLAFHEGTFWGGFDWALLRGVGAEPDPIGYAGTVPHQVFMAFQLMFAIITPALISGAFAERIKFSAMLFFMWLWSSLVYSPLCHWVWGSGGYLRLRRRCSYLRGAGFCRRDSGPHQFGGYLPWCWRW